LNPARADHPAALAQRQFSPRAGAKEHQMKTISLPLAAALALVFATPLAAQGAHGGRPNIAELRMQLHTAIARGTITRREAVTLRIDLHSLARLKRNYGRDGYSRSETDTLIRRGASLRRMIQRAESNSNGGTPPSQ
jgi:hypothetical protein